YAPFIIKSSGLLAESNIIPIAIDPNIAETVTITANMIIPLGNSLSGFFVLFTYGDNFSHPPTANTNIEIVVKYEKSNLGIIPLRLQSFVAICISLIAGAATIITTYNMDIINIAIPATLLTLLIDVIPFEANHTNTKN